MIRPETEIEFPPSEAGINAARMLGKNPDFGQHSLKLHLRGRMTQKMDGLGITREAAKTAVARAIANQTKVRVVDVKKAMHGHFIPPQARTNIWCVLGHDPGAYGYRLTDDGQEVL